MRMLALIALALLTGCGGGQKTIVGKWDCKTDKVTYADGQVDRYEYTADGVQIIKIVSGTLEPVVGRWKALDNKRFTSTFKGRDSVTEYKFEDDKLLFKSSSSEEYSTKCDRVK
jgi:hypothetical protein